MPMLFRSPDAESVPSIGRDAGMDGFKFRSNSVRKKTRLLPLLLPVPARRPSQTQQSRAMRFWDLDIGALGCMGSRATLLCRMPLFDPALENGHTSHSFRAGWIRGSTAERDAIITYVLHPDTEGLAGNTAQCRNLVFHPSEIIYDDVQDVPALRSGDKNLVVVGTLMVELWDEIGEGQKFQEQRLCLTGWFKRENERDYRKICPDSCESGNCRGERKGKNGGVAKTTPFIWEKKGRGHSAVDVVSWGVLSIDQALSSRLWTPVTRQFTLTIPIRIEFNSLAAARSFAASDVKGRVGEATAYEDECQLKGCVCQL
ncbi:hypothetical protein B0H14DRAFT_3131780 [Mycena olivaceomarginata]|nr:hypothetical protein B0H14DRAFT_3131780 [Mycena olivaceomarginata]